MAVTWLIMQPAGIYIARYCKHHSWWIVVHPVLMTVGVWGVVILGLTAIMTVGSNVHIAHDVFGLVVVAALFGQVVLGYLARAIRSNVGITSRDFWIRWFHKRVGFVVLILSWVNVRLGIDHIFTTDEEWYDYSTWLVAGRVIHGILVGFWVIAFVGTEIYVRLNSVEVQVKLRIGRDPDWTFWEKVRFAIMASYSENFEKLVEEWFGKFDRQSTQAEGDFARLPSNFEDTLPALSWADVSERVAAGSLWVVISGYVLDVRKVLAFHPGGKGPILNAVGSDVTEEFLGRKAPSHSFLAPHMHSINAFSTMKSFVVGTLDESAGAGETYLDDGDESEAATEGDQKSDLEMRHISRKNSSQSASSMLDTTRKFGQMKLVKRTRMNSTKKYPMYQFDFELPPQFRTIEIIPGALFRFHAILTMEAIVVERLYTPVKVDHNTGILTFFIKIYPKGSMSTYLKEITVGSMIKFREAPPQVAMLNPADPKGFWNSCALICAGSSLTVAMQLLNHHLTEGAPDASKIRIISFSYSPEDVIYRDELSVVEDKYPNHVLVRFSVSQKGIEKSAHKNTWSGSVGLDPSVLRQFLLEKQEVPDVNYGDEILPKMPEYERIFVCGRTRFSDHVCSILSAHFGYKENVIVRLL
jgi:ferredoxin-NADP reductase